MSRSQFPNAYVYNGQDFGLVEEDSIVLSTTQNICVWRTSSGRKDFIYSTRNGYSAIATNQRCNYIACAEYGLKPKVQIREYPKGGIAHEFTANAAIQVLDMQFSRNGKHLLMISGIPDFKISVFDTEQGQFLEVEDTLPCPETYKKIKFNPMKNREFVIMASDCIYFYKMIKAFEVDPETQEAVEKERFQIQEFRSENPELQFVDFIWDTYGRIHVWTDMPQVYMIASHNAQEEETIEISTRVSSMLLTQKHMIVAMEDGLIQWNRLEHPLHNYGQEKQNEEEKKMKVLDDVDQEFMFESQEGPPNYMHYSRGFKKILMGTQYGLLGYLPVEAEKLDDEDDDEENQGEKEKKTITTPFVELGRFHTAKINGVKPLGQSSQFVTISEDQTLAIWEGTTGSQMSRINQQSTPVSLSVSQDGHAAFVGSEAGVVRVFDVSNRNMPRLLKQFRFWEENIPVTNLKASSDGKLILASSSESDIVYIFSQKPKEQFAIIGHAKVQGNILDADFAVHEYKVRVAGVLSNNLLFGFNLPEKPLESKIDPIPDEVASIVYRKIDREIDRVITNPFNEEIYASGKDLLLKNYHYPSTIFGRIDFKKPPNAPEAELESHALPLKCHDFFQVENSKMDYKLLLSGGEDGSFILRDFSMMNRKQGEALGHAAFSEGITALCFMKEVPVFFTAGGRGEIMAWNPFNVAFELKEVQKGGEEEIDRIEGIEDCSDQEIQLFKEILIEEFNEQERSRKEAFKAAIMEELGVIKMKLVDLLEENERVTDIEKLERDDFVIDVEKQEAMNREGEEICENIRKDAADTITKLQLHRQKLLSITYDKMVEHQKGVVSIKSDMVLHNYSVRVRSDKEERRLAQVQRFRKMELREQLQRMENKLLDVLAQEEFSDLCELYFMNRNTGEPAYSEDLSQLEALAEFAERERAKKARRDAEAARLLAGANQQDAGRRYPIIKITKGRLKHGSKKKIDDDEAARAAKNKMQQREIKGMEELFWCVTTARKTLEERKQAMEKPGIYDMIYQTFELNTDARKRAQIELLTQVVFELKKAFNKEFKQVEELKENITMQIQDKNVQIRELLNNLKTDEPLLEIELLDIEAPERVLTVKESEITVEKYLTKEEREAVEAERRKREEMEKLLQGDNVNQRGLKAMLGGTELILKKDTNELESELVREEWMNKPEEEMNDEERQKYEEFLEKEREFKEKRRKAWEQELKKHKQDIIDYQLKFEERLLNLYKKKLFFDIRILEQELYIIRLTIMLHDTIETGKDKAKYEAETMKLEEELKEKEELLASLVDTSANLEEKIKVPASFPAAKEQEKDLREMFPDTYKDFIAFVRNGPRKGNRKNQQEPHAKETEMLGKVVELDPFSSHDKEKIKNEFSQEGVKETHVYERDRGGANLSEEQFMEHISKARRTRIEINKDISKLQQMVQDLKDHIGYEENRRDEQQEKYSQASAAAIKASNRVEKLKYNFEVVVYLRQGQNEVPQQPVATDYKDAILVNKEIIEEQNQQIQKRGDKKVKLLEDIANFKTGLKRVKYQKEKLDLEITDFEERAKDVQLYKVTKQTQEIIQGKFKTRDEEDKKRLEGQIKQLEENASKRIKTIAETKKKLRKEIKDKQAENEELEQKARMLKLNVDQRQQITDLRTDGGQDSSADPKHKFMQIAKHRKLVDIARQQTDEIDFLRDELDRLRARTFPSFAHIHNKPEYPDEV